jgi:hypothetical protein
MRNEVVTELPALYSIQDVVQNGCNPVGECICNIIVADLVVTSATQPIA